MRSIFTAANNKQYIPELDGLRGVAILLVISFHYFGSLPVFRLGWSGVDLFFVLSGFLITNRLLNTVHAPAYFSDFYRNRALRILPLYYTVLGLMFVAFFLFTKKESSEAVFFYKEHWLSFVLFFQNWTFILHGIPENRTLQHFWSLAIEEQFYLLWPVTIYATRLIKGVTKIFATALLIIIVVIVRTLMFMKVAHDPDPDRFIYYFFNSFCRMDGFLFGALIAFVLYIRFPVKKIIVTILLIFAALVIAAGILIYNSSSARTPFFSTIGYTLLALFYAMLVSKLLIDESSMINRVFKNPFLIFFGKISYGLYIFHWPVLLVLGNEINKHGFLHFSADDRANRVITLITCLVVSVVISWLSFICFESYFLKLKKKNV